MRTAIQLETPGGQKPGTALRSKGQKRVEEILQSARALLLEEGYSNFSMRTIAARAGIHLSNLQYYFPTREDLIHGLMQGIASGYEQTYEGLFQQADDDAESRFEAVLDFLIEDITRPETRKLFIQLYALLDTADNTDGNLLTEMYELHISNLNKFIQPLNTSLNNHQRQQKAAMIASIIEGMMLMYRDADIYRKKNEPDIKQVMKDQIYSIIKSST